MMIQRLNKQMKGEGDVDNIDILGNTTESAIQATKQALYNLDHPLEYVPICTAFRLAISSLSFSVSVPVNYNFSNLSRNAT